MESFGTEGFVSGAMTAKGIAMGKDGVLKRKNKDAPKAYVDKEKQARNAAEAKFATVYQGGEMVRNSKGKKVDANENSSTNNSDRPIEYYSSRTFGDAIRTKLNINKKIDENELNTTKKS